MIFCQQRFEGRGAQFNLQSVGFEQSCSALFVPIRQLRLRSLCLRLDRFRKVFERHGLG